MGALLAPTQVRQAVHQTIARLTAWSMKLASSGVGPDTGFTGEPLAKTSRGHLCGQQLGCGWRRSFFFEDLRQGFPTKYGRVVAMDGIQFSQDSLLAKRRRACFFAFKADLKARYELHNFKRYYRCNESPSNINKPFQPGKVFRQSFSY